MTLLERDLLTAIQGLMPYALSRVEDLDEAAAEGAATWGQVDPEGTTLSKAKAAYSRAEDVIARARWVERRFASLFTVTAHPDDPDEEPVVIAQCASERARGAAFRLLSGEAAKSARLVVGHSVPMGVLA